LIFEFRLKTKKQKPSPLSSADALHKKVAVIPFNPGDEFFPHIHPQHRPALMDQLFRIYRRTL